MARIPIALELFSVRNQLAEDLTGTLKAVADMGYEGVEFAGPPKHTGEELREALDAAGIVCCGWHTPLSLMQDDTLQTTIELNKTIGNKDLIIPSLPQAKRESKQAWLETATFFNELAGKLAQHQMRTGYHNHHVEFTPMDGEIPWDTFFGNTDKDVIMQLDTGNAISGGGDCVAILERYPGRAQTVHLKPFKKPAEGEDRKAGFRTMIGEDDTDWTKIFELCESTGDTEWYIVEYESDLYPPLEAVDRCLKALKAMGK